MSISVVTRNFPKDPQSLLPEITPDTAPFWEGLKERRIRVQSCTACSRRRWPVAPVCPHCGETGTDWQDLGKDARVFSWIRYHRSYLPEFEDVMPYVVVTAELDPDVRMYGRLLDREGPVAIEAPLEAVIERWSDDFCVLAFKLAGER